MRTSNHERTTVPRLQAFKLHGTSLPLYLAISGANPIAHVAAHLAQADETDAHGVTPVAVKVLAVNSCGEGDLAGEADGHQDVAVGRVSFAAELGLAREHGWTAALGEGQAAVCRAHRSQPIQQELGVEGNFDLGSGRHGLNSFAGLRVIAGARFDDNLALAEAEADRSVSFGHQSDSLDRLDQSCRVDNRLGLGAGGED